MNKMSQNKNKKKAKKQWLIPVAVAAVLVLILAIVLIVIRDQSVKRAESFEKVSQDFGVLYDATVSNYGMKTARFTCINLNTKFSEGSLICDARLQIEFDPMNEIDTVIDTGLRKSAVFDVISKDDAQTVYGMESTRWRIKHNESKLICTMDRVTYTPEQYQNAYQKNVESSRTVVIGDCTSNALGVIPKGYSYSKN